MTKTNAYSLVVILVRIGALYLFVRGLVVLVPVLWRSLSDGAHLWPMVLGSGTVLLIGAMVWLSADLIARAALVTPHEPQFESDLDVRQWQYVLFSAAGLWWAVSGLTELVWTIVNWWQMRAYAGVSAGLLRADESPVADLIGSGVQLACGIALLLGGRGLVALLHRLRGT